MTFGDPVEGEFYLPRPELDKVVHHFLTNRIHVVLIGPRRFGKTSFVFNLLKRLEKEGYACPFVDIFNITSHRDFLQQIFRALKAKKSWMESAKKWLSNWRPKLSADLDPITGSTSFGISFDKNSDKDEAVAKLHCPEKTMILRPFTIGSKAATGHLTKPTPSGLVEENGREWPQKGDFNEQLSFATASEVKEMIQDVLAGLQNLGEKVVLVIDEFQKVTELDDQGWLEATLRTHMQQLRNTSFLFTGSRKSIISDMLNDSSRPLYRSCQTIDFPSFGDELVDWVIQRFDAVDITIEKDAVAFLKQVVQDTPNYVQMVCFHLVAAGFNKITRKDVQEILRKVVRQNAYAYQTLLNSLSPIQQRVMVQNAQLHPARTPPINPINALREGWNNHARRCEVENNGE